jgi:hypothetical protein
MPTVRGIARGYLPIIEKHSPNSWREALRLEWWWDTNGLAHLQRTELSLELLLVSERCQDIFIACRCHFFDDCAWFNVEGDGPRKDAAKQRRAAFYENLVQSW